MTTLYDDTRVPADARLDTWLLDDPGLGRKAGGAAAVAGDAPGESWAALRRIGGAVLEDRVGAALRQVLPDPLVSVLAGAVTEYQAVREAARASLADPDGVHEVDLADRHVHARLEVDIDVRLAPLATRMPFVVVVDFDVVRARARVVRARLTTLLLDDPRVTGTVTAYGTPIESRTGTLRLGRTLTLSPPCRILDEREDPSR
jgi:hypothetical protein